MLFIRGDSEFISISRSEFLELKNLREEVHHLRLFRDKELAKYYESLAKLSSENEELRSKSVSNSNDALFLKHLDNVNTPARKDLNRVAIVTARRPSFPGSGPPIITRFDGPSKKAFNQTAPEAKKPTQENAVTLRSTVQPMRISTENINPLRPTHASDAKDTATPRHKKLKSSKSFPEVSKSHHSFLTC